MPRGRPPKPGKLHVVGGTWRGDRHGRGRGLAPPGQRLRARDRPPFVRGRAAKIWAEVLPAGRGWASRWHHLPSPPPILTEAVCTEKEGLPYPQEQVPECRLITLMRTFRSGSPEVG